MAHIHRAKVGRIRNFGPEDELRNTFLRTPRARPMVHRRQLRPVPDLLEICRAAELKRGVNARQLQVRDSTLRLRAPDLRTLWTLAANSVHNPRSRDQGWTHGLYAPFSMAHTTAVGHSDHASHIHALATEPAGHMMAGGSRCLMLAYHCPRRRVKPPVFKYHDPTSLEDALDLLAAYGDRAKVLAGGQSLMPLLNFRLARPEHLVDVNRIPELAEVSRTDGGISLGAMMRQRTLENSATIAVACPLLAQAMPFVGHPQIRNRGTLGGSLAHADPAAELPAVMLALDAQFTLVNKHGPRVVPASDFFLGNLTTALHSDEMLVRIELPVALERTGSSIREVAMRAGDFALAGVVACVTLTHDRRVSRSRIVCFGVGDAPLRVREAEAWLEDREPTAESLAEAGRLVSARVQPIEDIHASAAYRKRVSGILTARALAASVNTIQRVVS